MIRVAIIADSHFDEGSRFEECVRLHDWIAEDLARREVDAVLHAGDVFERRSTPAERLAVADWLRRVAAVAPVLIVRGNHDAVDDLRLFEGLATHHRVLVEEAADVHLMLARDGARTPIAVAALAWPRKAELLARIRAAGAAASAKEATDAVAGDVLRDVLRGLGAQLAQHDGPRIVLAHALVRGSRTSPGQPLVGVDIEVGLEDLGLAGADLVAVGHIHKGQDWEWGGAPVVYPGSPRRTAFGEVEPKGYLLVEFDQTVCGCSHGWARGVCPMGDCRNRGRIDWERVEVPATPMVLLETAWRDGAFRAEDGALIAEEAFFGCEGAEVRFRYSVDADQRDAAKAASAGTRRMLGDAGAVEVKLEEVVRPTTRARAPEIARAAGLPDKLRALWAARGTTPDEARAARLLGKVVELEAR